MMILGIVIGVIFGIIIGACLAQVGKSTEDENTKPTNATQVEKSVKTQPTKTVQEQWSTQSDILYIQIREYFKKASQSERFALYLKYFHTITFDMRYTHNFFERAKDNDLIHKIITQREIRDNYDFIIQRENWHYELSQKGKYYVKTYPFVCSNLPDYQ